MKSIKVSLITPVYNVEKYIENFIKSVINQEYKSFELIVVDDGTVDSSIELAESLLKKSKIRYNIIRKENGGQSSARNVGIDNANGEYVVFADSDDALQPKYLSNLIKALETNKADAAFCNINMVNDDTLFSISNDEYKVEKNNGKYFFKKFYMHEVSIGPYSLIIKKSLLKDNNLYFNELSRYSEEFIFITKLLYISNKVVHLKQRLYNYCLRKGSVSTSAKVGKILNGYNEIIKANEFYKKYNNHCTKHYFEYAMPRWIIATARFTSHNFIYKDYYSLLKKLNAKKNIKTLDEYPIKIKVSALCIKTSYFLSYIFFKHLTK